MVIYLDVVMIENFIINTFLLYITLRLMRVKIVKGRLIISSLVGTIYTLVMIFPKLFFFSKIPFQILIAFIMLKILLNRNNFLYTFKASIIFMMLSFMLAGICFKLSEIGVRYNFISKNSECNITIVQVGIALILVYFLVIDLYHYLKDRFIVNDFIYDVEITLDKKIYKFRGFLDTGNSLVEPVTKLPCILVEENFISNCGDDNNCYYIPYSVIGSSGVLKGYKTDLIRIKNEHSAWKTIQAMICPCKQVFGDYKEYNALLSRGII